MAYPFKTDAYARNHWYIAAWADEVAAPLHRTILGEAVLLYRTAGGAVVASSAVCPHRWMPLTGADLDGDALVCPYHGARFDRTGRCVQAPLGQPIPERFALKSYPVVEQGPCIWLWPGDPDLAHVSRLPDAASVGLNGGRSWRVDRAAPMRVAARAQLVIENLFDQSHVETVHGATLGAAVHAAPGPLDIDDSEARFSVYRRLPVTASDADARAVFAGVGPYLTARLRVEILGASLINSVGSQTYSADATGRALNLVGEMNFLHGVTPETATSCHYFPAVARNFSADNDAVSAALLARNASVIAEDIAILEAIEKRLDAVGDVRREVTFATDAGAMLVRRRMERLIAAETVQ